MSRDDGSVRYEALDWVMVRAPLLPIERYLALAESPEWPVATEPGTLVPADSIVRRALAVGDVLCLRQPLPNGPLMPGTPALSPA